MKLTDYQESILNKLLRNACIARDKACVRCGSINRLETSHIYSKGAYRALKWELENVMCLCHECHHEFWHKYPEKSWAWFEQTFPLTSVRLATMAQSMIKSREYFELKGDLEHKIVEYKWTKF